MTNKEWNGRSVRLVRRHEDVAGRTPIQANLTERTALNLALAISKLKQTTPMLPEDVEEILQALNYVLVGDPASVAAHRRMEAGKGMDPGPADPRDVKPGY